MAKEQWNADRDEKLLAMRGRGLSWKIIKSSVGITERRCQKRYEYLTNGQAKAQVQTARVAQVVSEDGLDRLIRKGKLRPEQIVQAKLYRSLYRMADLSGGVLKSCLNQTVGGGEGGALRSAEEIARAMEVATATRRLFCIRMILLAGQEDMLTVLDGVCGVGHTARGLAGGCSHLASELETVLRVALDIMHFDAHGGGRKAA